MNELISLNYDVKATREHTYTHNDIEAFQLKEEVSVFLGKLTLLRALLLILYAP